MNKRRLRNFLLKVIFLPGGCWGWAGGHEGNGYPRFTGEGGEQYAHREAYKHWIGPIPEGKELDHVKGTCTLGNGCVHPRHTQAVTHKENMERSRRGTMTVCKRGHALMGDGFRFEAGPRGLRRRRCRMCKQAYDRQRREA